MIEVTCPFGCPWRYSDEDPAETEEALAAHVQAHEDAKAAAAVDSSEESNVAETTSCKTAGCEEPSLGLKTGSYAGLCATHKQEKSAARAAGKTREPRRRAQPAAAPAAIPPPDREDGKSLTDLARSVDTAAAEVREARGRHERAVAALRAALDADV